MKKRKNLGAAANVHRRSADDHASKAAHYLHQARKGLDNPQEARCPGIWNSLLHAVEAWSIASVHAHSANEGHQPTSEDKDLLGKLMKTFGQVKDRATAACVLPAAHHAEEPVAVRPISIDGLSGAAGYHQGQLRTHMEGFARQDARAAAALTSGACRDAAEPVLYVRHLLAMAKANTQAPRGETRKKLDDAKAVLAAHEATFRDKCLRNRQQDTRDEAGLGPAERRFRRLDLDGARRKPRRRR
mgnify:CR=1 FL=1